MAEAPREAERILKGLTKAQDEAVTHEAGPLLIIAGAGTGKTTVITHRIAYAVHSGPWSSTVTSTARPSGTARMRISPSSGLNETALAMTLRKICDSRLQ